MPITLAVPGVQPSFDLEILWPWPVGNFSATGEGQSNVVAGIFSRGFLTGTSQLGGLGSPVFTTGMPAFAPETSGTGGQGQGARVDGTYVLRCNAPNLNSVTNTAMNSARWMGSPSIPAPPGPLGTGVSFPSHTRVMWVTVTMRLDNVVVNADNGTGFIMQPSFPAAPIWPTEPVGNGNRGGFGIVGDGAGNWTWRSFGRTASPDVLETVALPAHDPTEWHTFDFVLINVGGGRVASAEVSMDGEVVVSRNWTSGTVLDAMIAADNGIMPSWRAFNQLQLLIGGIHVRLGRFTPAGVELGV